MGRERVDESARLALAARAKLGLAHGTWISRPATHHSLATRRVDLSNAGITSTHNQHRLVAVKTWFAGSCWCYVSYRWNKSYIWGRASASTNKNRVYYCGHCELEIGWRRERRGTSNRPPSNTVNIPTNSCTPAFPKPFVFVIRSTTRKRRTGQDASADREGTRDEGPGGSDAHFCTWPFAPVGIRASYGSWVGVYAFSTYASVRRRELPIPFACAA